MLLYKYKDIVYNFYKRKYGIQTRRCLKVKSCVYKGKVYYVNRFEDFRDFMEDSVFDSLENFLEELLIRERQEGYEEAERDFKDSEYDEDLDIENDRLLDEIYELEQQVLDLESEKNDILKTIDSAIKDCNYTENYEELIQVLEDLL